MMVDKWILPHSDAVMEWVSGPRIIPAMWFGGKKLRLDLFELRKALAPLRGRQIVERSEPGTIKWVLKQS
jgi:hypothetical protein